MKSSVLILLTLGLCSTAFAQQFDVSYQGAGIHVGGICVTCDNSSDMQGTTTSRSGVQDLMKLSTALEQANPHDYRNLCQSAIASYKDLKKSPEFLRQLDDKVPGKALVLGLEQDSGVKLEYLKTVTVSQGFFRDSFNRLFDLKDKDVYFRSANDNMVCRISTYVEWHQSYLKSCKILGKGLISDSSGLVHTAVTVKIPYGKPAIYRGSGFISQFHGQYAWDLVDQWKNDVGVELHRMKPGMSNQEIDLLTSAYQKGKGCNE